jgi:outer membrane protein OmpA-like peptidoglycan-associated protein
MRAIVMLAAGSVLLGMGAAAGQELISKDAIKASLLGPTRAIGKKQRAAVDLPTVTFDFNSAALTTQGEQQLDILASAVKEIGLAQQTLTIEGHTDASGSETYNQELSERRAASAKDYLVSQGGLDPSQLNTIGFGKSRPLPDKPDLAPEQRRIEVVVGTVP